MRVSSNDLRHMRDHYARELDGLYGENEVHALFRETVRHYAGIDISRSPGWHSLRIQQSELISIYTAAEELRKGRPLQYITGEAWFYDRAFCVSPAVLIPRPETEELADMIIRSEKHRSALCDIGTGSGCIAVTLALQSGIPSVTAIDISAAAIEVAKKNADRYSISIRFCTVNILVPGALNSDRFDLIVSNPPYIATHEKESMHANVLDYEPHLALFAGNDPLIFYSTIISLCGEHLLPGGALYFELNPETAEDVRTLALKSGHFRRTELLKDISGKLRFLHAVRL